MQMVFVYFILSKVQSTLVQTILVFIGQWAANLLLCKLPEKKNLIIEDQRLYKFRDQKKCGIR